jgi:hypothetical protein
MRLDTSSKRVRSIPRLLVLLAVVGAALWGCSHGKTKRPDKTRYAHGRIHVDQKTSDRWDTNEKVVEDKGDKIKPISPHGDPTRVPLTAGDTITLKSLDTSERHGASDKRILSKIGPDGRVQSADVIAEVILVKGSEYKEEEDFQKGWLPLAIVFTKDFSRDAKGYEMLALHGGTSWVYVREDSPTHWIGSLVRIVGKDIEQVPLDVTALSDSLEPVLGARFMWEAKDESIWAGCGGKCCRMVAAQHK